MKTIVENCRFLECYKNTFEKDGQNIDYAKATLYAFGTRKIETAFVVAKFPFKDFDHFAGLLDQFGTATLDIDLEKKTAYLLDFVPKK